MEVELPDSKRTELDEFKVQLQICIDILDVILGSVSYFQDCCAT